MALESACFNYSEVWLTTVQPHSFVHSINLSIISHDPSRTQIMVKTDKLKRSHFLSLMKRLLQGRVQGPGTKRREVLPSLGCSQAHALCCLDWLVPVSARVVQRNRTNRGYTDMYELDNGHWLMRFWRLRSPTACSLLAAELGKPVG